MLILALVSSRLDYNNSLYLPQRIVSGSPTHGPKHCCHTGSRSSKRFHVTHKGHSQAPAYHKNVIINRWHIGWPLSDGCYQWFVSSMQRRKLANDMLMITSLFHELFLFTFFLNTANIGEVVFFFVSSIHCRSNGLMHF